MKTKLIEMLKENGSLKYGEFVLRGGETSSFYCDIKQSFGNPKILQCITQELKKILPKEATCIAGNGLGGTVLATSLSLASKLPLCITRDTAKKHGTKKEIEGYVPSKQDIVCIVDDVFSTGSSIRETKKTLKKAKVEFTKSIVVLDRSQNKKLNKDIVSLLVISDLK